MKPSILRLFRTNLVLIDTSAWICYASRKGFLEIKNAISQLLKEDRCAITGPTFLEIIQGTRTHKERNKSIRELSALHWLSVTDDNWRQAAHLAFILRRKGITISGNDVLIATVAIKNEFELMHYDKDFEYVAMHSNLKLFDLTPYNQ
jgi:predicted nucleic acid-binding protein